MIELKPLAPEDRAQFILDNQEAFNYGALEEFGLRDDHFEEDGEIISRETNERSSEGGEDYRIRTILTQQHRWTNSSRTACSDLRSGLCEINTQQKDDAPPEHRPFVIVRFSTLVNWTKNAVPSFIKTYLPGHRSVIDEPLETASSGGLQG